MNNAAVKKAARHIVITGFMGTGKTTTGQIVANLLERQFMDMDVEIVQRAGLSIPQIFNQQGENAFRQMERALLEEIAQSNGKVIATGGGALVSSYNRQLMQKHTFLVCLTASPEMIETRLVAGGEGRPLAAGWRELLEQRAQAYADIHHQIDTSQRDPQAAAKEIIALWQSSM